MLVTFKTKSYANITMFGVIGTKMLEMMNFGTAVPGAIAAADVAQALSNLQTKLETLSEVVEPVEAGENAEVKVSLQTRAVPLLALLESAVADENHVMWE